MIVRTAKIWILLPFVLLAGCTSSSILRSQPMGLSYNQKVLVVPFLNNSDTPAAGEKAANLVAGILRAEGMWHVTVYQSKQNCDPINFCQNQGMSLDKMYAYAAQNTFRYVVTGTVNEWRYKIGLDGEPSVGMTMSIKDGLSDVGMWSAVGSKTGHSWNGVSETAQDLFQKALSNVNIQP